MKKYLLFFLIFISSVFGDINQYLPTLTGRVVDNGGILNQNTIQTLNALFEKEENNSSNQIVVATIKSLHGYEIEDFSIQLARKWALGQKDKDNGVLLLIAKNERKVRIEVGYGLEGALTDKISHEIITYIIIPAFKKGDFNGGVLKGSKAIISAIKGEYKQKTITKTKVQIPIFFIFFLSFVTLMFGSSIKNDIIHKLGFSTFMSGFGFLISYAIFEPLLYPSFITFIIVDIIIFLLIKNIKLSPSAHRSSNGRIGSSGGFSGGFGGGGFSGGGGGFGGGGASGGW